MWLQFFRKKLNLKNKDFVSGVASLKFMGAENSLQYGIYFTYLYSLTYTIEKIKKKIWVEDLVLLRTFFNFKT